MASSGLILDVVVLRYVGWSEAQRVKILFVYFQIFCDLEALFK